MEVRPAGVAKFIKNWQRGIYNRKEAYYGLLENGVPAAHANEILDTKNQERFDELVAKYGT
jgi:hypothetical protein